MVGQYMHAIKINIYAKRKDFCISLYVQQVTKEHAHLYG